MKLKNYILPVFIFISVACYSQITVTLSGCGANTFNVIGVDGTGRNIYQDGAAFANIQWNSTSSQWEIVILPSTVWFSNTFASTPNPPCASTGTWVTVASTCGNITTITGNCQTTPIGINELNGGRDISVFPNPSNRAFNFDGLENGSSIQIYDIMGRLVLETISKTALCTVDLFGKDKGMYLFRIKKDNAIVKQGKLMLQ
jgi:hypothetical protein